MRKNKKNKYHDFPRRVNVKVGESCSLAQCNHQIRKAARPFVFGRAINRSMGIAVFFPTLSIGMQFSGINKQTGDKETFQVISVQIMQPLFSGVKRIK